MWCESACDQVRVREFSSCKVSAVSVGTVDGKHGKMRLNVSGEYAWKLLRPL